MKDIIIERASNLFVKYGINAVRTEDVSMQAGISKRTLYIHFTSKNQLVERVVDLELDKISCELVKIQSREDGVIDQFLQMWDFVSGYLQNCNRNFFLDISRYYPSSRMAFERFKSEFKLSFLVHNLHSGMVQGLYRADIDVDMISRLWFELVRLNYLELKSDRALKQHFIRGLLTCSGAEILEKTKRY